MLTFDISNEYIGTGVSHGLDRGLLVYSGDVLLLEEGMGLGACALQTEGYTYFTSIKNIKREKDSFEVECTIDKKLVWKVLGVRAKLLTRILEGITSNIYMKQENKQRKLLRLGGLLCKVFSVNSCFVNVKSQGEVRIVFEIEDNEILVDLSCKTEKMGSKLFVMNELGGSIFNKGIINHELIGPPSGWNKIEKPSELYSPSQALAFTLVESHVPDNVRSTLFWGRELAGNSYCWAGFESEILCESSEFENYRYSIKFREVEI
ncbi:MAG: hypothetical protein ACOH15_02310 [Acetobacterium sp.]